MPTWLGCPLQILTDQGPNFESNLFQQLCRLMCVDKIRTTPYKPSTNGNIERFHGTMHSMLAKLVSENQRDWDEKLPAVAFAYRASGSQMPHRSSQRSATDNLVTSGKKRGGRGNGRGEGIGSGG